MAVRRRTLKQCGGYICSDEGMEGAVYDSYAFRKFMGTSLLEQDVPDTTILLHFRHLLEENGLNKMFFDVINWMMEASGHMMKGRTIADVTMINAPGSTKDAEKKRDLCA